MTISHGFAAFIDFETTGLDTEHDEAVEFCAMVYEPVSRRYLKTFEGFFQATYTEKSKAMLNDLCGLDTDHIAIFLDDHDQFRNLCQFIDSGAITHFVAHNAPFDRAFFNRCCMKILGRIPEVTWIDSGVDYPFRDGIKTKRLSYLAADHGFLNPFAHRAFADCLTLYGITKQYDWQDILKYSLIPTVRIQAMVSYADKDKAKNAGFRWDDKMKAWYLEIKKTYNAIEELGYDFPAREIKL